MPESNDLGVLGGAGAEHYTEALELLNRAESGKLWPAGVEPSCEGQAEGAECWMELESHPGCYVWDDYYYADQLVTWTGGCSGGLACGTASGLGALRTAAREP